ncbi:MAG: hypothetical protein IIB02_03495 [Thaumarchaeota archaeon]|nr:hypothetical protein [Nitrososphaerota archaeon]
MQGNSKYISGLIFHTYDFVRHRPLIKKETKLSDILLEAVDSIQKPVSLGISGFGILERHTRNIIHLVAGHAVKSIVKIKEIKKIN